MPSWDVHFNLILEVTHRQIVQDVAQVHALSRVIRGVPIPPTVQRRLDRLNILRAVRGTTGIEGTELSEEEVGLIMESPAEVLVLGHGREREEQETRNAESGKQKPRGESAAGLCVLGGWYPGGASIP